MQFYSFAEVVAPSASTKLGQLADAYETKLELNAISSNISSNYYTKDETNSALTDKLDKTTLVAPFAVSATYEVGMRCVYNNTIYRCTTFHDAMPWDPSDFVVDESTISFLRDTGGVVRGPLTVN